jgi:sec-independent protein translocase protein TatC
MTLWEHLDELRGRLIKMILAFIVGGGVAWGYKEKLLAVITQPFVEAWKAGGHAGSAALYSPAPAAAFLRVRAPRSARRHRLRAADHAVANLGVRRARALLEGEALRRPVVVSSCLLFAGGGYFGWKVAFPLAFKFLLGIGDKVGELEVEANWMINDYLDFVSRMLLAFGVAGRAAGARVLPVGRGIITYKHMIKFFRYFLVLDFIVAAIVTPPDVMSQLLLAIPLALLYGSRCIVAWIFGEAARAADRSGERELSPRARTARRAGS